MRRRRLYRGSSSLRVVDILDAVGAPLTLAELETEYEDRFKPVSLKTLQKSCQRLREEGYLASKLVENPLNPDTPRLEYRLSRLLDQSALRTRGRPAGAIASLPDQAFWGRVKARQDAYFDGVRP